MAELEPRDEARVRSAMRSFFELSRREQLRMFELMGEYLSVPIERETDGQRIARVRALALHQMRVVAEHGGRPPGRAPTRRQYMDAVEPLGLALSFGQVVSAFESWRNACEVFEGRWHHESAEQHAQRVGGQRSRYNDALTVQANHVEGVRRWLATDPPRRSRGAYTEFARRHNEAESRAGRPPGHPDRRHFVNGKAITDYWGAPFRDFIAFVRGDLNAEDLRRRATERTAASRGDLMFTSEACAHLGMSAQQFYYAVRLGRIAATAVRFPTFSAWLREDILLLGQRRLPPRRDPERLRMDYLSGPEVAALIRMRPRRFDYYRSRERWDQVPPPDGRLARFAYWRRSDVERWLRDRDGPAPPANGQ